MLKILLACTFGLVSIGSYSYAASSTDSTNLPIIEKHYMSDSMTISISPKGQKVFENSFDKILGNMGYHPGNLKFGNFEAQMDSALDINEEAKGNPERWGLLQSVRQFLSSWVMGLNIQNPLISIKADDIQLTSAVKKFSLTTDSLLMSMYNKTSGAILTVDIELESLKISSQKVRAMDFNNSFIGEVGMDGVTVKIDKRTPLTVRVPIFVDVDKNGNLIFQSLPMKNNVNDLKLSISYGKLIVPKVVLVINGHEFEMSQSQIEKILKTNMPDVLKHAVTEKLPEEFNKQVRALIEKSMEYNFKVPVAKTVDDPNINSESLFIGFRLEGFSMFQNLKLHLKGFIEDPLNTKSIPDRSNNNSGFINYNNYKQDYDVAVSVNTDLINRYLQLSYERGAMKGFKTSSGEFYQLKEAPQVDTMYLNYTPEGAITNDTQSFIKLKAVVQKKPTGVAEIITFKDVININIQIVARVSLNNDLNGLLITPWRIDLDKSYLDASTLTWFGQMLSKKVRKKGADTLTKFSKLLEVSRQPLDVVVPLPQHILGTKITVKRIAVDDAGYFLVFEDFNP